MHSADAMILLTRAGLVDGRLRMDDEAMLEKARYWSELLGDMTLEEGLAALALHHRTMTSPPQPANLLANVRVARQHAQRSVQQARQARELTEWLTRRPFTDEERAEADAAYEKALAEARAQRNAR